MENVSKIIPPAFVSSQVRNYIIPSRRTHRFNSIVLLIIRIHKTQKNEFTTCHRSPVLSHQSNVRYIYHNQQHHQWPTNKSIFNRDLVLYFLPIRSIFNFRYLLKTTPSLTWFSRHYFTPALFTVSSLHLVDLQFILIHIYTISFVWHFIFSSSHEHLCNGFVLTFFNVCTVLFKLYSTQHKTCKPGKAKYKY